MGNCWNNLATINISIRLSWVYLAHQWICEVLRLRRLCLRWREGGSPNRRLRLVPLHTLRLHRHSPLLLEAETLFFPADEFDATSLNTIVGLRKRVILVLSWPLSSGSSAISEKLLLYSTSQKEMYVFKFGGIVHPVTCQSVHGRFRLNSRNPGQAF